MTQSSSPNNRANRAADRTVTAERPSVLRQRLWGQDSQHLPPEGLILFRESVIDTFQDAFDEEFDMIFRAGEVPPLALRMSDSSRHPPMRSGIRTFVPAKDGDGYWDFFKVSDRLVISVTDAVYRQEKLLRISATDCLKLRVLLTGELRKESGAVLARGPQAVLFAAAGERATSYRIAPEQPIRMIVLHVHRSMLTETLGWDPARLPPPIDAIFAASPADSTHCVALHPEIFRAAQRMVDSRLEVPSTMRLQFLEALATTMLVDLLRDLQDRHRLRGSDRALSLPDLNRVLEARDYLSQNFANPPRIPELARIVGINRTKLKEGFRRAVGKTIYQYILQCRMERASELLLSGQHPVSKVGFMVGYEHPANFTSAFRRFCGCLPRAWRVKDEVPVGMARTSDRNGPPANSPSRQGTQRV